jgi:A/G-specific adenine glycosylase
MNLETAKRSLIEWYAHNKRELPWRSSRDPYRIWISETMLQQTTTTAVIPYFERFVGRFPSLKNLAQSPVEDVLEAWSGLGYYSRARNLHKAAQALFAAGGFPRSFEQLIEYPGFGPYTARSVASLAFDEPVGVVDGNVIRVLSRVYGKAWRWWEGRVRSEIQTIADRWVRGVSSYEMNQAIMELGRTICTPKSPSCLLCPLRTQCTAFKKELTAELPLSKPRREREIWIWEPSVQVVKSRVLLELNETIPFARGHWIFPGEARQVKAKPKKFDYKHSITHHDIYVTLKSKTRSRKGTWVALKEIRRHAQTSLVDKALSHWNTRRDRADDMHERPQKSPRRT